MTLTPQMRALGAMFATAIVTASPFTIGFLLHADWVTRWTTARTHVYVLWAISFMASYLAYLFVYRRYAPEPSGPAAGTPTKAELSLITERLPKSVWLTIGPPILIAAALWWITTHSSEFPWRYGWDGPVENNPLYRKMVTNMVLASGATAWIVACGLAVWFGMSRANQFRRALLLDTVLIQWLALIWILDSVFWNTFRVSVAAATVAHTFKAAGICILVWIPFRLNKFYGLDSNGSARFYCDPRDPAYRGPRGVNLASAWSLLLLVFGVALLILAALLLRWSYT